MRRCGSTKALESLGATCAFSIRPAVPVYWRCTPTVHTPSFRSPGLVDPQHRIAVAEMAGNVVAQVVAHSVAVPDRAGQQVPHGVWIFLPGVLGDGPAFLPQQVREQPEQERPGPAAGLDPANRPALRSRSLSVSNRVIVKSRQ